MVTLTIINSSVKPLTDLKRSNFALYVYKRYYADRVSILVSMLRIIIMIKFKTCNLPSFASIGFIM